jgi:lipopolysaccharide/colanic/teichoic acid biosynthesis glycosyltransferase
MSFFSRVLEATVNTESKKNVPEPEFTPDHEQVSGTIPKPLPQAEFRRILCQERKRSERSRKSFLLMLVRHKNQLGERKPALERIVRLLGGFIRETDTLGWFEAHNAVGVIFSELGNADLAAAVASIESKANATFSRHLDSGQVNAFEISFYSYPRSWKGDGDYSLLDPVLYPDLVDLDRSKRASLLLKRAIDILGSSAALIVLSPLFAILAVLIKCTSKGPIFFRQQRLGQFQIPFSFLKFRSMHVTTSPDIHRAFVTSFIAGTAEPNPANGSQRRVYKLTNDPRITTIGKFMRRTSLDEIPQFWNVLMGQMSLVGPRPPIGYEIEAYDVWHRRRLLEAKPGITGLWQVHGRSRTTFDDMVRLDLRYAKMCSPVSDLKILIQTPRAVFSGDGAY